MKKLVTLLSCWTTLFLGLSFSLSANDYLDRPETYAGFYLSMPLGGKYKENKKPELQYGFKMDYRRSRLYSSYQPDWSRDASRGFQPTLSLVDLRFTQSGFRQMNVANLPLVAKQADGRFIYLGAKEDGEEEEGGRSTVGNILFWTGVVTAGIIVVGMTADCINQPSEEEIEGVYLEFCPI